MRRFALSALLLLLTATTTFAQQVVFVVRHAERADAASGGNTMMASDPELSEAGHARARALATTLKDAGLTGIFTTQYKRTKQTAEPLAQVLPIRPTVVDAKDVAGLIEKATNAAGNVLIVGHSNTVPDILKGLGVSDPPRIADNDYDDLFIVIRGEKPALVRLHYR